MSTYKRDDKHNTHFVGCLVGRRVFDFQDVGEYVGVSVIIANGDQLGKALHRSITASLDALFDMNPRWLSEK
jgi:hypothetical protein